MSQIIDDPVFGKMTYNHMWVASQKMILFGRVYDINLAASAYTGDDINDTQRNSYLHFMNNQTVMMERIESLLRAYTNSNEKNAEKLSQLLTPTTLLFDRNGRIVMFLESKEDPENGLGVRIYPDEAVNYQDAFL